MQIFLQKTHKMRFFLRMSVFFTTFAAAKVLTQEYDYEKIIDFNMHLCALLTLGKTGYYLRGAASCR